MTRAITHALLVAAFLGTGALVNAISRYHPQQWRLHNAIDSAVTAACLIGMAVNWRREK